MASTFMISVADYPIKSVTVFKSVGAFQPSKAEVVRTFALELQAGQNKIEIKGLPSTIDTHSARVSGLGDARLFDVVCTIDKDAQDGPDSSSEIIRRLIVKKESLESEKRVREHEADLLVKYAQTLTGEHVKPVQMSQFLESFIEQGRKNLLAVNETNEKIVEAEREIKKETAKQKLKRGLAQGAVTAILVTEEKCSVNLKLTYLVSDVEWIPTYELYATTENGKPSSSVSLHYRARISQSTGEDWTNTTLTLSTATSDMMVKRIPKLLPVKIRARPNISHQQRREGSVRIFGQTVAPTTFDSVKIPASGASQQQPSVHHPYFGAFGGPSTGFQPFATQVQQHPASGGGGLFGARPIQAQHLGIGSSSFTPATLAAAEEQDFQDIELPTTITEPTTIVTETPIAISYSVYGKSTIPSDGVEHQVSMAALPLEAKISYITVPRVEPQVYLQCQVKNTSEYRLLPGPVSVLLDDSYASRTYMNDVSTGDNFNCTLSNDAVTMITYSRSSQVVKDKGGTFTEALNTTTHTTKITIHNKHQFTIPDLIIRDVIPTCDDTRAKVILRKPEGLADAKAGEVVTVKDGLKVMWENVVDGKGGEKEGQFKWECSVAPGTKETLELQWEVKAPADTIWSETAA